MCLCVSVCVCVCVYVRETAKAKEQERESERQEERQTMIGRQTAERGRELDSAGAKPGWSESYSPVPGRHRLASR